jgi:hypothetical protein
MFPSLFYPWLHHAGFRGVDHLVDALWVWILLATHGAYRGSLRFFTYSDPMGFLELYGVISLPSFILKIRYFNSP